MKRWLPATLAIAFLALGISAPAANAQPLDTETAKPAEVVTPQHIVSCDNVPYKPFKASSDGRIYAMGSFSCNFPPDDIYEELDLQVWNGTQGRWLNVSTRSNMTPHGGKPAWGRLRSDVVATRRNAYQSRGSSVTEHGFLALPPTDAQPTFVRIHRIDKGFPGKPGPSWQIDWMFADGTSGASRGGDLDYVAASLAARPCPSALIQDPETGEWSPWSQPGT